MTTRAAECRVERTKSPAETDHSLGSILCHNLIQFIIRFKFQSFHALCYKGRKGYDIKGSLCQYYPILCHHCIASGVSYSSTHMKPTCSHLCQLKIWVQDLDRSPACRAAGAILVASNREQHVQSKSAPHVGSVSAPRKSGECRRPFVQFCRFLGIGNVTGLSNPIVRVIRDVRSKSSLLTASYRINPVLILFEAHIPLGTTSTAEHAGICAWLLGGLVTLRQGQHWLSPVRWLSSLFHMREIATSNTFWDSVSSPCATKAGFSASLGRNHSSFKKQKSNVTQMQTSGKYVHVFWILLALALQTLEIVTRVSHPSKQPHRKIRKISKNHRTMLLVIPSIPSSGPSICCNGSAGGKKNDGAVSCDAVSWGAVSWAAASWDAVSPETCEAANCEVRPGMPKCGISWAWAWACACAASMYWAARRLCCDSMVSACNADVASGLVLGKQVHHWHAMSKQVPIPIDA